MKIEENSEIRGKQNFTKLRDQATVIKTKDLYSWEDLESLEKEESQLDQKVQQLEEKTIKLEEMASKKRGALAALAKRNRDEDGLSENVMKNKRRENNEQVQLAQKEVNELEKREKRIQLEQSQEVFRMQDLERRIREINDYNHKRESELEDKLRNHRYLQRKRSKNPQTMEVSPKRHSHSHRHK